MTDSYVLLVEDDAALRDAISDVLSLESISFKTAVDGIDALAKIKEQAPALVITDIQMPKMHGYDLLKHLQRNHPNIPCVLMTAYGKIEDAVKAIQWGSVDYIPKPFEPDELVAKIQHYLQDTNAKDSGPVAQDSCSKQTLAAAQKVAKTQATVLIGGESGTGKEVLAKYIHNHSKRSDKAFVAINCAAIPENMLEAMLFGYEKGAFTGAIKSQEGKFEQAQGGTLLLDEISEMDLGLQAKLLRVIQEKEVERLGSKQTIPLDVRLIATTNRDLLSHVQAGKFREDLYYRLNVFPIKWSPLRERTEDIMPLLEHLLAIHAKDNQVQVPVISEEAIKRIRGYEWPGNIRELDNVVQRAMILHAGGVIEANDLGIEASSAQPVSSSHSKKAVNHQAEEESSRISQALGETGGNKSKAAELLGISPRTLRYKLAKLREAGITIAD